MDLGQKLKQARLEAGLSQRQLCGDTITRNMLSQIENGSANPSYATLQILCARLGKPVSFFREDAPSENLAVLHKAQYEDASAAMQTLQKYLPEDPILDPWYYMLFTRCSMDLAESALKEGRTALARNLLVQAEQAAGKVQSLPSVYAQRLTILQFRAGVADALSLVGKLPDNTEQMLLRAAAALQQSDPERCLCYLNAADRQTDEGIRLRADAFTQKGSFEAAIQCYQQLEDRMPEIIYPKLELCYRELGDFKKAYEYACKQR